MSNQKKISGRRHEALKRLKIGVSTYNEWKAKNPTLYIDFISCSFAGMDLRGANFRALKFKSADFSNCNLSGADFSGANLNDANLSGANCSECNFSQARLMKANFSNSTLDDAIFYASIMTDIILDEAKCSRAYVQNPNDGKIDSVEIFDEKEFETVYGARRVKAVFNDGMQPVDLLALPFHVDKILRKFEGSKIVFCGLSTLSDKYLEFRIERSSVISEADIQSYFDENLGNTRKETINLLESNIKQMQLEIETKNRQIEIKDVQLNRHLQNEGQMLLILQSLTDQSRMAKYITNVSGDGAIILHFDEGASLNVFNQLQRSENLGEIVKELDELRNQSNNRILSQEIEDLKKILVDGSDNKFLSFLKGSGKEILTFARDVGKDLVVEFLKASLGLPK